MRGSAASAAAAVAEERHSDIYRTDVKDFALSLLMRLNSRRICWCRRMVSSQYWRDMAALGLGACFYACSRRFPSSVISSLCTKNRLETGLLLRATGKGILKQTYGEKD